MGSGLANAPAIVLAPETWLTVQMFRRWQGLPPAREAWLLSLIGWRNLDSLLFLRWLFLTGKVSEG